MITYEKYFEICVYTYYLNVRLHIDRKITKQNLRYSKGYWVIETAAKMAAIAGEMIYENQVY